MNQEDYLAHHGVMGMRWGVRRQQHASKMYNRASSIIQKQGSKYNATKYVNRTTKGKHFLNGVGTTAAMAGAVALLPVSPLASAAVASTAFAGSGITKALIDHHSKETLSYIEENDNHTINSVKDLLENR